MTDDRDAWLTGAEDPRRSLRMQSIRGGGVSAVSQAVKFAANLASVAILSRLLSSGDFGIYGMVFPVAAFFLLFRDMGLATATVQQKEVTHGQVSTLFWISFIASLFLAIACVAVSPLVSLFYRDSRTGSATAALAAMLVLGGVSIQHQAILNRHMRFISMAIVDVCSAIVGLGIAITLAWYGWGYWALVGQNIGAAATGTMILWLLVPWRPAWPKRGVGVRRMLRFGGLLTTSNILSYVSINIEKIVMGRVLGADVLGAYTRGWAVFAAPMTQITAPITAVMVPALAKISDDPVRVRRVCLQLMELLLAATAPFSIICAVFAVPVVRLVLGQGWDDAAWVVECLAAWAFTIPLGTACTVAATALGRADALVKWNIWGLCIRLASLGVGLPFGLKGVALSLAISSYVPGVPLFFATVGNAAGVSIQDAWSCVRRVFVVCVTTMAFALLVHFVLKGSSTVMIVCAGTLMVSLFYAVALYLSGRLTEIIEPVVTALRRR